MQPPLEPPPPPTPVNPKRTDPRHPERAPRRWTRVRVDSSHTAGRCDDRRLVVAFDFEDDVRGQSRQDDVEFEVPTDFHTHNDSVAAAVMTMLSTSVGAVEFNFPISERCAEILRAYYLLDDVGPVDPELEPRPYGRRLALNFSGGVDSRATMALLDELMPGEYRVVTSEYGGWYAHEAIGFGPYRRDVSCRTNFRQKGYARGRFNAAVPLLFADYLDLESLATGHGFAQDPLSVEQLLHGETPRFRIQEAAFEAGGVHELHLVRGMCEAGLVKVLSYLPAEQQECALNGSSTPSTSKFNTRGTILRGFLEADGRDVPPFLDEVAFAPRNNRFGTGLGGSMNALYLLKKIGLEPIREFWRGIEDIDPDWLASLSLGFLTKYNPNYLGLLPEPLRGPLLTALCRRGIEPCSERDWQEFTTVFEFMAPMLTDW